MDGKDDAVKCFALDGHLLAARGGELVVARAAIVFRRAPLGLHPTFEEQALERWVQRAFSDLEHLPRERLDPLSNAVAMQLAGCQRSKDKELERAREIDHLLDVPAIEAHVAGLASRLTTIRASRASVVP